jgi:hypothetical protein
LGAAGHARLCQRFLGGRGWSFLGPPRFLLAVNRFLASAAEKGITRRKTNLTIQMFKISEWEGPTQFQKKTD